MSRSDGAEIVQVLAASQPSGPDSQHLDEIGTPSP